MGIETGEVFRLLLFSSEHEDDFPRTARRGRFSCQEIDLSRRDKRVDADRCVGQWKYEARLCGGQAGPTGGRLLGAGSTDNVLAACAGDQGVHSMEMEISDHIH
ncbi:hypothetical protein ACOMHN_060402 [Nucella lapillus]